MTIDVDTIASDAALDEYLGGQCFTGFSLCPKSWEGSLKPARQYALDEALRLLARAYPAIAETDITDTSVLKRAILVGAAARLYELAVAQAVDPSVFLYREKAYRKQLDDEVKYLGDALNKASCSVDPKGRSRRSVSLVRR
jgi:hypothetical protein